MGSLLKLIGYGVGLLVLFILVSTLVLPQFDDAWRYCQALEWVAIQGGTMTNCSTPYKASNESTVLNTSSTHTEDGITSPVDTDTDAGIDEFCLNCATEGGYRDSVQGILLLALVVGAIAFGLYFFRPDRISI